ncbi:MAG: tetratricopeptide repeat protein, partial [Acetobacteraceae bacterium]
MARFTDRLAGALSPNAALARAERAASRGRAAEAFALFARAAQAGLTEAKYRVGRAYLEGAGVPPSPAEAARWLERAANDGNAFAQSLLAQLYLQGVAPPAPQSANRATNLFKPAGTAAAADFEKALRWAKAAAAAGTPDGQAILGYLLTSGPAA